MHFLTNVPPRLLCGASGLGYNLKSHTFSFHNLDIKILLDRKAQAWGSHQGMFEPHVFERFLGPAI